MRLLFHLFFNLIIILSLVCSACSKQKSTDEPTTDNNLSIKETQKTQKTSKYIISNNNKLVNTNSELLNSEILNFDNNLDALVKINQMFSGTEENIDYSYLSNYLENANYDECNHICYMSDKNEYWYTKRIAGSYLLDKSQNLVDTNRALCRLIIATSMLGDKEATLSLAERVQDDDTGDSDNFIFQALHYLSYAYQDKQKAKECAERLVNMKSKDPIFDKCRTQIYLQMISLEIKLGEIDKASVHLEHYKKMDGANMAFANHYQRLTKNGNISEDLEFADIKQPAHKKENKDIIIKMLEKEIPGNEPTAKEKRKNRLKNMIFID